MIATGTIRFRSLLAVVLMSYSAAAWPATPLLLAPERTAALLTASRICGVAFIAAVELCGPAVRPARNWITWPSLETYSAAAR